MSTVTKIIECDGIMPQKGQPQTPAKFKGFTIKSYFESNQW